MVVDSHVLLAELSIFFVADLTMATSLGSTRGEQLAQALATFAKEVPFAARELAEPTKVGQNGDRIRDGIFHGISNMSGIFHGI